MKLLEAVTKKAMIRQMMNAIKEMLGDKTLPKSTTEHLEALDGDLKKTWETLSASGESDQSESLHESMTIGTRLEGNIHTVFTDMVDDLYEQGALSRDEHNTLVCTVNDIMDAFYTAIMQDCPQLYDRSPWMDAPEPDAQDMMAEKKVDPKVGGGVDRDKIPAEDFAGKNRSFPIVKPGDVSDAASSIGRAGKSNYDTATLKANIIKIAKRKGAAFTAQLPQSWQDAKKESLAESADLQLLESDFTELIEKSVRSDGTATIKIIAPGWGASGYYPPEILQRDGPKVFKAGLQQFWNHQTVEEEASRPEGDLNNLAAKLVTDARWMPDHPKGPGLYADAQIYEIYQKAINDMGPDIGVSIRALGKAQAGQAEGRQGPIIQEIAAAKSVDFVTKPGAGGAVLQLFESARRGAAQTHTPEGEITMGEKELLEANAQLKAQLEQLQEKMILREAGEYVATKMATADLPTVTKSRLNRELVKAAPIKDGKLDLTAFDTQISEAVKSETAYLVAVTGGGKITGMGGSLDPEPKPEEALASMKESYMAMGYSEASAALMAKGR